MKKFEMPFLLCLLLVFEACSSSFDANSKAKDLPLPKLSAALSSDRSINVVVFGSSVAAGAGLPDSATQSPLGYLVRILRDKTKTARINGFDRAKNGSIVAQMNSDVPLGAWPAFAAEGTGADVVLIAYGMNDGFPAMYNNSQPPEYFALHLKLAVLAAQASGAEVILATTPHPLSTVSWRMPDGYSQTYPTFVTAPVDPERMIPAVSMSMTTHMVSGINVPASKRHLEINQRIREVALITGAALIDVEPLWFAGLAANGESLMYNSGEFVHPSLLAHQLTYQKALDILISRMGDETKSTQIGP